MCSRRIVDGEPGRSPPGGIRSPRPPPSRRARAARHAYRPCGASPGRPAGRRRAGRSDTVPSGRSRDIRASRGPPVRRRGREAVPAMTVEDPSPPPAARRWSWPDLMRHTFAVDVLACPRCGSRMRVVATIEDPVVVRRFSPTSGSRPRCSRPGRRRPTCSTGADLVRRRRLSGPRAQGASAGNVCRLLTPGGPPTAGAEPSEERPGHPGAPIMLRVVTERRRAGRRARRMAGRRPERIPPSSAYPQDEADVVRTHSEKLAERAIDASTHSYTGKVSPRRMPWKQPRVPGPRPALHPGQVRFKRTNCLLPHERDPAT